MSAFLAALGWKMVFYTVILLGVLVRLVVVSRRNARLRAEAERLRAEADTLHAELVRRQADLTARETAASEAQAQASAQAKAVPDNLTVPELIDRLRETP